MAHLAASAKLWFCGRLPGRVGSALVAAAASQPSRGFTASWPSQRGPTSEFKHAIVFERPTRKFDRMKLRKPRKWAEIAPYVTHIDIQYDPANDGTLGCFELWKQVANPTTRKTFPKYALVWQEKCDFGPTAVAVKFVDGRELRLDAQHLTVSDLYDQMSDITEDIEEKEEWAELEKP